MAAAESHLDAAVKLGSLLVLQIDSTTDPVLQQRFHVEAYPSLYFLKNGETRQFNDHRTLPKVCQHISSSAHPQNICGRPSVCWDAMRTCTLASSMHADPSCYCWKPISQCSPPLSSHSCWSLLRAAGGRCRRSASGSRQSAQPAALLASCACELQEEPRMAVSRSGIACLVIDPPRILLQQLSSSW